MEIMKGKHFLNTFKLITFKMKTTRIAFWLCVGYFMYPYKDKALALLFYYK